MPNKGKIKQISFAVYYIRPIVLEDYGTKLSNEALNSTTHEPVVPAWNTMNDCDGNLGGLQKRLSSRCRLNGDDLVEDEEEHMLSFMQ